MCGNACGRLKRTGQLGQRDITVLGQQFFEEGLMRASFPCPLGRPRGAGSIAPVSCSLRFHLTPVAADSFSRAAAARPLKPSAMYSSKRARSADGNGAGIRHPPGYLESRQQQFGNPKRFKIHDRRFKSAENARGS